MKSFSAQLLANYLLENNWIENREFTNPNLVVFNKFFNEYDKEYKIVYPSKDTYEDFQDKVMKVIRTLSILEKISENEIISSITYKNGDLLKFRIRSSISDEGYLPLHNASMFINQIYHLISSAIEVEKHPMPYYKKLTKDSVELANQFKFHQTEVGSFVFNIETDDLSSYPQQLNLDLDIERPLTRKSFERIMKGFMLINHENDYEELQGISYRIGLNANMCDALIDILQINEDISIETTLIWSPIFESNKNIETNSILDKNVIHKLASLSEYYKDMENYNDIEVIARITTLNSVWLDSRTHTRLDHVITITWYDKNRKRNYSCKVQLDEGNYRQACDAHRDNKRVLVKGKIDMNRKRWIMEYVSYFEVIN